MPFYAGRRHEPDLKYAVRCTKRFRSRADLARIRAMPTNLHVSWLDRGTASACPPDPSYPDGTNLDLALDAAESCWRPLDYPARDPGILLIECRTCGLRVACGATGIC